VAFDQNGELFVTDNTGGTLFEISTDGQTTILGSNMSGAAGVAFDNQGNMFVASNSQGTISKFAPDGEQTTFASGLANPSFLAFEPVSEKLLNVSARGLIQGSEQVLIGGFIVGGNALPNNLVVIRAVGPSLAQAGVSNPLLDPVLELHDATGVVIASNDNWQDTQRAQIMALGLSPSDARESAIVKQLPAGNYTAVVRGTDDSAGTALVEVFNVR
jgi:hypothetical protein